MISKQYIQNLNEMPRRTFLKGLGMAAASIPAKKVEKIADQSDSILSTLRTAKALTNTNKPGKIRELVNKHLPTFKKELDNIHNKLKLVPKRFDRHISKAVGDTELTRRQFLKLGLTKTGRNMVRSAGIDAKNAVLPLNTIITPAASSFIYKAAGGAKTGYKPSKIGKAIGLE